MENIDMSNWPTWLVALLLILNLFREPLAKLLPDTVRDRLRRSTDREEHEQMLEETVLDHRLQRAASEELRQSWREEQYLEFIAQRDEFIRQTLNQTLAEQNKVLAQLVDSVNNLRMATVRTNDLLVAMNRTLNDLSARPGYVQQHLETQKE